MKFQLLLSLIGSLLSVFSLQANNIQVSNVSLTGQVAASDYTFVEFDLSWENSWRISVGPANYDAAWVFLKFRNGANWSHGTLNYVNGTNDGHAAPAGATINTTPDGVGIFIYRDADGSGNVNWQNIQLRWNYGVNGVGDDDLVDIQVFAIEMVYVPTGSFPLGAGGTEVGKFYSWVLSSIRYTVNSENAITVGSAIGNLNYSNSTGNPGDRLGPIPAAFPKGYNAFYCMKYEASQEQWVAFFNTLNVTQKSNHDLTDGSHKNSDNVVARNGVAFESPGSATTTNPNIPVNYVSWADIKAYLDWSGLRPMTELEYEKACRGGQNAVANEFAWGNANIHSVGPYTVANDGEENSLIIDPGSGAGNAFYQTTASGFGGPLRCGIFAASANTKNREETGGSYFGIMELTGNLYERCVTVGDPTGRAFEGDHGNGILDASGNSNVANWPTNSGDGGGFRGGSYANSPDYCRVSDRYDATNAFTGTNSRIGFRGVRTAN
jgi:formylglycine-generating enzyme required for sulfatase activity